MARSRQRGLTLLELIIAVAIIGIGAAIAVPTFSNTINNARVRNAATGLQISLMRARSEATKRNAQVRVVPIGGDWAQGWEVRDTGNTVVEAHGPLKGTRVTSAAIQVVYLSSGRLQPGLTPDFQLIAGPAAAEKRRCVTVDLSGRAYVKEAEC